MKKSISIEEARIQVERARRTEYVMHGEWIKEFRAQPNPFLSWEWWKSQAAERQKIYALYPAAVEILNKALANKKTSQPKNE